MPPTLREALLVALGGALGSAARYLCVSWWMRLSPAFPAGTLVVNVLGCFLFGALAGWTDDRALRATLGAGFLGGFTTFSAFGGDTLSLADAGGLRLAALNVALHVGLGLAAAWVGRTLTAAG